MKPPSTQVYSNFQTWQRGLLQRSLPKDRPPTSSMLARWHEVDERQRQLGEAVSAGSEQLSKYLVKQLDLSIDELSEAPTLLKPLTPSEFRNPTLEIEHGLYAHWRTAITPRDAARPLFWTICHAAWLLRGDFHPDIQGALLGSLETGAPEQERDDATRNLLRRMGGLHHVRGKVSVRVDCPLSRAWWRGHHSELAALASHGDIDSFTAHRALHASNGAWASLSEYAVRRITMVNYPQALAALVWQFKEDARGSNSITGQRVQAMARRLARVGHTRSIQHIPWEEIKRLADIGP